VLSVKGKECQLESIFVISGIALAKYTREAGSAWGSEFYLSMRTRHLTNARKDNVKM